MTATAAGSYSVTRVVGDLVYTSGMTPRRDGSMVATGTLGAGIPDEFGRQLGALATSRALDAAQESLMQGELLLEVVSLTVFIAAHANFTRHSHIADAASDVVSERLPWAPLPVRATVGVTSLPAGAPVEVQLIAVKARNDIATDHRPCLAQ